MIKKTLISIFLLGFFLAIWAFIHRDVRSLRENIKVGAFSVMDLKGFEARRYHFDQVKSYLKSDRGRFLEPNRLELNKNVEYTLPRKKQAEHRILNADRAFIFFEGDHLTKVLGGSEIEKGLFYDQVFLLTGSYKISTDFAEYRRREGKVFGHKPVSFDSVAQKFSGDQGFLYFLENEDLELFGKVEGMFLPDR